MKYRLLILLREDFEKKECIVAYENEGTNAINTFSINMIFNQLVMPEDMQLTNLALYEEIKKER